MEDLSEIESQKASMDNDFLDEKEEEPKVPESNGFDDLSNKGNHYGTFKNRPVAPGFGVPLMNFDENPLEQYKNRSKQINCYEDLVNAQYEIKNYEENSIFIKIIKAEKQDQTLQMREKRKLDRAFDIIDRSFTYGAKLKRNPMSALEKAELMKAEVAESFRFDIY